MTVKIDMKFRLPFRVEREGDVFVSICDPLDVSSQGDTREEAGRMLLEALQLFLETCIEAGTVEDVLRECGFVKVPEGTADLEDDDGGDYLDVPIELLMMRSGHGLAAV